MNPDFGKGKEISDDLEERIRDICRKYGLTPKTPPHDLASWIVQELED